MCIKQNIHKACILSLYSFINFFENNLDFTFCFKTHLAAHPVDERVIHNSCNLSAPQKKLQHLPFLIFHYSTLHFFIAEISKKDKKHNVNIVVTYLRKNSNE
jgi:hypothetical protein